MIHRAVHAEVTFSMIANGGEKDSCKPKYSTVGQREHPVSRKALLKAIWNIQELTSLSWHCRHRNLPPEVARNADEKT